MLRSGVGIVSQIGVESTAGTSVAANRYTPTLNWMLKRMIETKDFRGRGSRVPTTKVQHKKCGKGEVNGVLDYNSIIYLLSGIFPNPTPVQIGALTAYTRVYTPGVRTADSTRKTFTVEIGDETAAEKYAFCQLLGLNLAAGQDDFTVKSDAVSRYPTDNVTLTATPTEIAERPVERNDINVYIDTSNGGLGGTQVTEAFAESLDVGSKFKEVFVHNRTAGEFYDVVEIPYAAKFSFETAHNAQSRSLIAEITNNPTKWIRWEAIGASLGTHSSVEYFEKIWIDLAVKFEEPEPLENEGDPYGYKYVCQSVPDLAGLGSHLRITVVNSIATL